MLYVFNFKKHLLDRFLFFALFLISGICSAQDMEEDERFISSLNLIDVAPEGLLASRSVVLFSPEVSQKQLEELQKGFQRVGIDAVLYAESSRVFAGPDMLAKYQAFFSQRDIRFIIFLGKVSDYYSLKFLPFKNNLSARNQQAWLVKSTGINGLLGNLFRSLTSTQRKQNYLVNDFPERNPALGTLTSRRLDGLAPNVRSHKIAVPKMPDPDSSAALEEFLKVNLKGEHYEIVENDPNESELMNKGFIYILNYIHTRGVTAKEILGYDLSKSESAFVTVSYSNGILQLKTIPADTSVYKFYIKKLEDGIIYLGLKWDADITWQDGLKNHLDSYRITGKIAP
jgi:hypothetical protein